MGDDEKIEARKHVMPADPPDLGTIALRWYVDYDFGQPHTARESNIAVEAFKDGYRAALSPSPLRDEVLEEAAGAIRKLWFGVSLPVNAPTFREMAESSLRALKKC